MMTNTNSTGSATVNGGTVEEWLNANPEAAQDFFLRKADRTLINKWLNQHGYAPSVPDSTPTSPPINASSRASFSHSSHGSTPTSPSPLDMGRADGIFSSDARFQRSNSKKHLRQDFAKSKSKNMFRTYEPRTVSTDAVVEARRGSLKEMRMFRSLPPNSGNMLSLLIQSKVRLPRYPSKDIELKRELRYTNERDFFLEIVKDISNDLDLKSLSAKIVANISVLVDGDDGSLFVVEDKANGKGTLVSKMFDVHSGTRIIPSNSGDGSIRIPWGKGIIGYVAETGEDVNLLNANQVRFII
jgi:dual 3',5'-cyclic-AMP and -GMP phosphodiesterase 11